MTGYELSMRLTQAFRQHEMQGALKALSIKQFSEPWFKV